MYAITIKTIHLELLILFAGQIIASALKGYHAYAHRISAMLFLLIVTLLQQPPPLLPPQPQQHQQPQQQPQQFYAKTNVQA